MKDYLLSILPRLQRYSQRLDEEANFIEKPWAFVDGDGDTVTYLFRRSHELLVSKQGEVATGRWEYLPTLRSLLIEHEGRKRLYNQGFLDKAVMILRKDGTGELFALANSQMVPDLDVIGYLEGSLKKIDSEAPAPNNPPGLRPRHVEELSGGGKVVFWGIEGYRFNLIPGVQVTKEDQSTPLPSGEYRLRNGDAMVVEDGLVKSYKLSNDEIWSFMIIAGIAIILILLAIWSVNY